MLKTIIFIFLLFFSFDTSAAPCPPHFLQKGDYCFYPSWVGERLNQNRVLPLFVPEYLSAKKIAVGRFLFFDPLLSKNNAVSCATCHNPRKGFSDGRNVSVGIGGRLTRSAPSLWNVAFFKKYFWDSRAASLEAQAKGPLYHPSEMGSSPEDLVTKLTAIPQYRSLFAPLGGVTEQTILEAISDFQRTFVSLDSPFDRGELSEIQHRGFNTFRSFVSRCTECHELPLFTNFEAADIGIPGESGVIRIPPLRNIALTAPYMHAGNLPTLQTVVDFYNEGIGRKQGTSRTIVHWHIRPMGLSSSEKAAIISFLESLTDTSWLPEIPREVPSGLSLIEKELP